MTLEFTARFDDSLADYIKEQVEENLPDMDNYLEQGQYADPTDYFDMSDYVTDDDALTDKAVEEIVQGEMGDHIKTMTTLATTLQAITDALVAGGFVPTGWQAIPTQREVA